MNYFLHFMIIFGFLFLDPCLAQQRAILVESVQVPILMDGKQIGSGRVDAGKEVEILLDSGDFVEILTPLGSARTPASNLRVVKDELPDSKPVPPVKQYPPQPKPLIQTKVPRPEPGMVIVEGGKLPESSKLSGVEVASFQIGKDEVSIEEWEEIRKWGAKNGYNDLPAPKGDYDKKNMKTYPITGVSWYEVLKWCNAKSEKHQLDPVYYVDGSIFKVGDFGGKEGAMQRLREYTERSNQDEPFKDANFIEIKKAANGYRLPTEAEWEWAARGGRSSKSYLFSGSNNIEEVAWYQVNHDIWWEKNKKIMEKTGKLLPLDRKKPNELGIFNMSGFAGEWCEDLDVNYGYPAARRVKGGSLRSEEKECSIGYQDGSYPFHPVCGGIGFRLARSLATNHPVSPTTSTDSCNKINKDDMVTVKGGKLPKPSNMAGISVQTFQIARYEVTWTEWQYVRAWAVKHGYDDLGVPGTGDGAGGGWQDVVGAGSRGNHPVRNVSWFDVVKWCNAKSEMEGYKPVYYFNKSIYRTGFTPTQSEPDNVEKNPNAVGYRLPMEAEWEWAQRGGVKSKNYTFSGSNVANDVSWHEDNSGGAEVDLERGSHKKDQAGRGTWPVGSKKSNEIGIYDMSGNVEEWVFNLDILRDRKGKEQNRRMRGGSWNCGERGGEVADLGRSYHGPYHRSDSWGFRLARSLP